MAATVAIVSSCLSTTTSRHRHFLSISVLKSISARLPLSTALFHFTDQLTVSNVQNKINLQKITAFVAQEEVEAETEGAQAEALVWLQNTKLYIGNLPYNCDSEQLACLIQEHASPLMSPLMIEVLYDKETERSRGFAFVTMGTIQDCRTVINNLNGFRYDGRTLRVKFSEKSKPKGSLHLETEFKLFVGNLSWSVTSEALKQVFKDYGNLVSARVLYDGETGRSRGYGFVCFSTKKEMDTAMESLNGVELGGRALRISLALAKKT